MVNVIEKVLELSIGEGLKVNQIYLTPCPKPNGENRPDTRWRLISNFTGNTYRTGLCVQLCDISGNVRVSSTDPCVECLAFCVVRKVTLVDVRVRGLKIGQFYNRFDICVNIFAISI